MRPLRVSVVDCGTAEPSLALMLHQRLGQDVLARIGLAPAGHNLSPDGCEVDVTSVDGRVVMRFSPRRPPGERAPLARASWCPLHHPARRRPPRGDSGAHGG